MNLLQFLLIGVPVALGLLHLYVAIRDERDFRRAEREARDS